MMRISALADDRQENDWFEIELAVVRNSALPIAVANASGSPGSTSQSERSPANSATPPTRVETNGVPHARLSFKTFGKPSERLVRTVRSAARYQSGNWSCR